MKKKYMIPETEEVRLQPHGGLLIASLTGGEVGAPEMTFDDGQELPGLPGLPSVPVIPGMPGMSDLGPDIPGL